MHFDLRDECRATSLDLVAMETLVNRAGLLGDERITAPGLGDLRAAIWDDIATMMETALAPLRSLDLRAIRLVEPAVTFEAAWLE